MDYTHPEEIFEEMRRLTPSYAGMTYRRIDRLACSGPVPRRITRGMHLHQGVFPRGKGLLQGIEHEEPAELTNESPGASNHWSQADPL